MPRPLPPSPYRRIAKWTGLVACDVILAMWAINTCCWTIVWYMTQGIRIGLWDQAITIIVEDWGLAWIGEWGVEKHDFSFHASQLWPDMNIESDRASIRIPLWILLVLVAIPTAIFWRRDRRSVKPGHCQTCGYDLRASKKTCPECGTAIDVVLHDKRDSGPKRSRSPG